jgi:multiple sugar transport system permease protein
METPIAGPAGPLPTATGKSAGRVTAKRRRRRVSEETLLGWLFLVPAFLVLAIMVGYPALIGFWYSLSNKMLGFPKFDFVGLDNYISILGNPTVLMSYVRAFIFSITSVAIKLPLGLGVALLLNQSFRGRGVMRGIVLLPWALPLIVGVLIWVWMYNDLFGVINYLLMSAHITQEPLYFLGSKSLAMPSIILVNIWRGFPFFAVNILAGLQSIPDDLYEAGRVDGANRWQLFTNITLPGLRTVILVTTLLSFIWTTNDFTTVYTLTGGGPGTATMTFSVLTWKTAFNGNELGKAAAIPILLMPIFIILIIFLTRTVTKQEGNR